MFALIVGGIVGSIDTTGRNLVRRWDNGVQICEPAAPTISDEKARDYLIRPSAPLRGLYM